MKALFVSDREFDTILAALRLFQEAREGREAAIDSAIEEIAENGREGDDAALLVGEIDELCDRINCSDGHVVVAARENAETQTAAARAMEESRPDMYGARE